MATDSKFILSIEAATKSEPPSMSRVSAILLTRELLNLTLSEAHSLIMANATALNHISTKREINPTLFAEFLRDLLRSKGWSSPESEY